MASRELCGLCVVFGSDGWCCGGKVHSATAVLFGAVGGFGIHATMLNVVRFP